MTIPAKYRDKSTECHCGICLPKGQICDYCNKPAKHAFAVAMTVLDPSSDIIYHGCEEHREKAEITDVKREYFQDEYFQDIAETLKEEKK